MLPRRRTERPASAGLLFAPFLAAQFIAHSLNKIEETGK
jgi:hypothetical protein